MRLTKQFSFDPITFHAADVSEPLVRRSPSNVARPPSPMIVALPASLRLAKHDQTHDQRFRACSSALAPFVGWRFGRDRPRRPRVGGALMVHEHRAAEPSARPRRAGLGGANDWPLAVRSRSNQRSTDARSAGAKPPTFFKARTVSRGGRLRTAGPQVAEQPGEAVIADERVVADVAPICNTSPNIA